MKFIKQIAILIIISLLLTSCTSELDNKDSTKVIEDDNQKTENVTEDDSSNDNEGINVVENIFTVELTIPAELVGDTTQEELENEANKNGYKSAVINDDGSATYIMTKTQHNILMDQMKKDMSDSFNKMIGSEDYPNFTEIEYNNDFTEFIVTTTSKELTLSESFSSLVFYMYSGMYTVFNGSETENIHIDFINEETGEIINEANSEDLGE